MQLLVFSFHLISSSILQSDKNYRLTNSKVRYIFLYFLIIILGAILRLYSVADRPHDLYVDEVAIGYNAYSILKTGRDEYGNIFPLFFRSFNDYKLPLYIYFTSVSEFFFGETQLAVRLPSVLAGIISVAVFSQLIKVLSGKRKLSLLAGFFLSVSSWHLQFSRAGFEASLSLLWLLAGTLFIISGLKKKKNVIFCLGLAILVLGLYTYHTARIFVPVFLPVLLFLFGKETVFLWRIKRNWLILIFIAALCVPFIFYAFSQEGLIRAGSESFLQEVKVEVDNYFSNIIILDFSQFWKNYSSYFSLDYLFFWGDQIGRHSVRELGMNYIYQLPFFLIGSYFSLKRKNKLDIVFISWFLISPLATSLAVPNPHALRSLSIIIPLVYFVSLGVIKVSDRVSNKKIPFSILTAAVSSYFFLSYLHIYYVHYPRKSSPDWSGGYKEAIEFVRDNEFKYENIMITEKLNRGYIYLYFYGNFDPKYISGKNNYQKDSGKYKFVTSPFQEKPKEMTLYVSPFWEDWHGTQLKKIYNRGNDWVFTLWEN